jgi:adenine deaminase
MASLVITGGTLFDGTRGEVMRGASLRIEEGVITATGILAPGYRADVIVVRGDPLADIRVLQELERITHVIKAGTVVARR